MFDVLLNDVHPIITDLDIFREVGHATAHDEYIQFTISRGKLFIKNGGVSEVRNGRVRVSFIKGQHDNPKINAIVLVKGSDVSEFPRLPPLVVKPTPKTNKEQSVDDQDLDLAEDNYVFDEPRERHQGDNNKHDDFEDENEEGVEKRIRRTSGPKQPDPYGSQENSSLYTILFIIVAMIIPIVILKCRL